MKRIVFAAIAMLPMMAGVQDRLYDNEFPLGDVEITGGVLKHARDLNIETLLQYDCDRLLPQYKFDNK